MNWPQASKEERPQFNNDADFILEAIAKVEVDQRFQTMTTIIIISCEAERFGQEEKRAAKLPYTMSNGTSKIHKLRQRQKCLKKWLKESKGGRKGSSFIAA